GHQGHRRAGPHGGRALPRRRETCQPELQMSMPILRKPLFYLLYYDIFPREPPSHGGSWTLHLSQQHRLGAIIMPRLEPPGPMSSGKA
ncbi:stromal cell-derived factor 1 isoform 5 precursor, partial [Daubentonia madagascariensis]